MLGIRGPRPERWRTPSARSREPQPRLTFSTVALFRMGDCTGLSIGELFIIDIDCSPFDSALGIDFHYGG